jgi:S1-C subfamily serine protease
MNRLNTIFFIFLAAVHVNAGPTTNQQNVSAPMTTDLSGQTFSGATNAVYRILCQKQNRSGTGFLHKSGRIITAAHVIEGCIPSDIMIVTAAGQRCLITNVVSNTNIDVALLAPAQILSGPAFSLTTNDIQRVGAQVCTWGFPAGYSGLVPLLSVGYLSGKQQFITPEGKELTREIVNAAFNSGNSGGPLLDIETHNVLGVVVSKLAPLPQNVESIIAALHKNNYGMMYTNHRPDGTTEDISEAQLLADVIDYLRGQVQLVIGYSTTSNDLRKFIQDQGLTP